MIPVTTFRDRAVAVFGLGLSGITSARALMAGGARVVAWDDGDAARERAVDAGLALVDLTAADWSEFSALVLAPGVPLTHPQPHWTVNRAHEAGVEIIGDTELFFRELAAGGSKARIIGITGTNGKSTSAALIAHLLGEAGVRAALGGNIGHAVLALDALADDLVYVIEFSSYQIDLTPSLAPDVGVLLNISPDHLDRHGSMQAYAAIKARMVEEVKPGGTAVIGLDDSTCCAIAGRLKGDDRLTRISVDPDARADIIARDGRLFDKTLERREPVTDLTAIPTLRGRHNWQNAAAAYAVLRGLGLSSSDAVKGFESFPGLPHRMEEVGRLGRVLFINDSKATNAEAAAKALACFGDIYWIAGGRAKAGGIESLAPFFPRIRHAYLVGEAAGDFAATLEGKAPVMQCGTVEKAAAAAAADAARSGASEPVVLLSPACASFDQFPNFMTRGDAFRSTVVKLEGIRITERTAA